MAWQDKALCAEADPDAFFPDRGVSTATAERICRHCPVSRQCFTEALVRSEKYGVWGGINFERQRRRQVAA